MSLNNPRSGASTPSVKDEQSPDIDHHPPIKKNAFVHKLYSMLNDPNLKHLIWWNENNEHKNTFSLYPGKEFSKILTNFFKHGNVSSFVRQLHMYGFHKISDNNNDNQVWEFKHSSGKFKKDDEESLIYIKRRSSSNNGKSANSHPPNGATSHPHHPEAHMDVANYPAVYQHQIVYPYYVNHDWQMHQQQMVPPGAVPLVPGQPPMIHPHPVRLPMHQPMMPVQNAGHMPPFIHPHHSQMPTPSFAEKDVKRPKVESPAPPPVSQTKTPEVQQYNPLQFRKIWETSGAQASRPRNPSLLFDPLAPAPLSPSRKFSAPATNVVELPRSIPNTLPPHSSISNDRIRPSLIELYNSKMNHEPHSANNSIFSNKSSISSISSLNRNSINDNLIANEPTNFKPITPPTNPINKVTINSLIDEEKDS